MYGSARKHRWTGQILRYDELLCNLMERDRRRLQMLEDLYENNSFEVLCHN